MENVAAPVLPLKIAACVLHLDSTLPGWTLLDAASDTPRTFMTRVAFEQPFGLTPVVHAGISGFDLELETWLGTRIWSVDVSWLAIGN